MGCPEIHLKTIDTQKKKIWYQAVDPANRFQTDESVGLRVMLYQVLFVGVYALKFEK